MIVTSTVSQYASRANSTAAHMIGEIEANRPQVIAKPGMGQGPGAPKLATSNSPVTIMWPRKRRINVRGWAWSLQIRGFTETGLMPGRKSETSRLRAGARPVLRPLPSPGRNGPEGLACARAWKGHR